MADSKVTRGRSPHASQAVVTGDVASGTDTLAAATDQLNTSFATLERRLRSFGVSAFVNLPIGDPFDDRETHRLEFGKFAGAWRLTYVTDAPDGFDRTEEVPLVTASRSVRLVAAEKVNELVRAIRVKAAEELQSVRGAIAAVESAMAELPEPPSSADDLDSDDFDGDIPF